MAAKRSNEGSATTPALDEPAEKKAKTDVKQPEPTTQDEPPKGETEVNDSQKKSEKHIEKEQDSPKDPRAVLKDAINFDTVDTTLNVVPTTGGRILSTLSEGGMQYLIAGARGNVGMKAGRYMFEVRILEVLNPVEGSHQGRGRAPLPRQLVRVGFSTATSSLVLGYEDENVAFDSEGFFLSEKKRIAVSERFGREQSIGVLLNLDKNSPNAFTISAFRNGERISAPQPLPEHLKGKPLFPHVCFRNVTIQVHFGPQQMADLPFKCRMIQEAAKEDTVAAKNSQPKDGKYEVVFPVAFPDEGAFDWVDGFLKRNPNHVELSDRMIVKWAIQSGVWKPKSSNWKNSNDKPDFNFGLPAMDDLSARRVINAIAPAVPRNYLVMEVKQNLVKDDRKQNLQRFAAGHFKKVAHVIIGEPSKEFKEDMQTNLLEEKRGKVEVEWKAKKLEKERKKLIEKRQKEMRKLAEEEKKRAAEKKRLLEAKNKGDDADKDEQKDVEMKGESGDKDSKKDEEEKKQENEDMEEDEEKMPEIELTEEEKKMWFRNSNVNDLTGPVMSASFPHFTLPEKDEGFDEITYDWQPEDKSKEYLKQIVEERKITSRIEDLQPSEWFKTKYGDWQKAYSDWQAKQKDSKESKGEKKNEKDGDVKNPATEPSDIFSVEDITDIGNGEPLFDKFTFEDWALLSLRFELYLLAAAYKKDVNDPGRIGIHEANVQFYYSRYFQKQLNPKYYGVDNVIDLTKLVNDCVCFDTTNNVLLVVLPEGTDEIDIFVKMTEESRRERQRRIDAGDETARLKFSSLLQHQQTQQQQIPQVGQSPLQTSAVPESGPPIGNAGPTTPGLAGKGVKPIGASPGPVGGGKASWQPGPGPWQGGKGSRKPSYSPRQPFIPRWRGGQ